MNRRGGLYTSGMARRRPAFDIRRNIASEPSCTFGDPDRCTALSNFTDKSRCSARFKSRTFTRGSPKMRRLRPVIWLSRRALISAGGTPRARATRATCRAALAGLISGSRPEADVVSMSAGSVAPASSGCVASSASRSPNKPLQQVLAGRAEIRAGRTCRVVGGGYRFRRIGRVSVDGRRGAPVKPLRTIPRLPDQPRADDCAIRFPFQAAVGLERHQPLPQSGQRQRIGETAQQPHHQGSTYGAHHDAAHVATT